MRDYDIPSFLDFLSPSLLEELALRGEPVSTLPALTLDAGLQTRFGALLTAEALAFVVELYEGVRISLRRVLEQRRVDRAFIDAETLACGERNRGKDFAAPNYETVIGKRDAKGRVVIGPIKGEPITAAERVEVPDFLRGEQVTLFGPPDSKKLAINAMNSLHRRLPDEPELVARLVENSGEVPRWGADSEDSKTPLIHDLLSACENLSGCFDGSLHYEEEHNQRRYELAAKGRARPIKRIPGLALPTGAFLVRGNPLPLHILDFALHLFHNWKRPEALVFYVPKLENEEEAAYIRELLEFAEQAIARRHGDYRALSVKIILVFENPRAIFRIQEMARALAPYFLGGSLGWHDYLASTARLFKHDPHYRIPVKADPHIVIKHIKESHLSLVGALAPFGALKIGGMYGVLYEEGNARSFAVSMAGYIRDVITQLRRGLDGFWVAHPAFVRIGLALVAAWRKLEREPNDTTLEHLISGLVLPMEERQPLLDFIRGKDAPGLQAGDPLYLRRVLAADLPVSELAPNHHPDEVRYNIFQALQYLADWLSGNGCVALPARLQSAKGEEVFVRVMDDLATTERSRWELWAEIYHGRFSLSEFLKLLREEVEFIRRDQDTGDKRIQVRWQGEARRWYPISERLLRQLATDPHPVEFVSELLLPFTLDFVRRSVDPWAVVTQFFPGKYHEA